MLARLASGGMGEVYVAQMSAAAGFEKTVVIKRLLPELARDESFVKLFLEEARLTARLTHPNICQVFELTEVSGEYYLVMEYLEGLPLSHLYQAYRGRGVDARVATGLCVQACQGLEYAHSFRDPDRGVDGIVHRDVSPHNLMLTVSGLVKLLDFGVAKLQREGSQTVTGSAKGKYAYMSPEQLHCEPLDRRSDIFSLGVVLFEMLSGTRLFRRKSELASMQAIVDGDRPRLVDVKPNLPRELSRVLDQALGSKRHMRFPTARAFAEALGDAMSEGGGPSSFGELATFILDNHTHELEAQRLRIKQATDRVTRLDPSELEETSVRSTRHRLPLRAPTETKVAVGPSLGLSNQIGAGYDDDYEDDDDEVSMHVVVPDIPGRHDQQPAVLPAAHGTPLPLTGADAGTPTFASELVDVPSLKPRRSRALVWLPMALVMFGVVGWLWYRGQIPARPAEHMTTAGPASSPPTAPATTRSPTPRSATENPDQPVGARKKHQTLDDGRPSQPIEAKNPDPADEPSESPRPDATDSQASKDPGKGKSSDEPARRKRKQRERVATSAPEEGQGYLTVDAVPYADIYIGGRKLGVTPLVAIPLPAGEHTVKAVSSAGEKRLTIRIENNQTTKRRITF